jgi:hypothetical protein
MQQGLEIRLLRRSAAEMESDAAEKRFRREWTAIILYRETLC